MWEWLKKLGASLSGFFVGIWNRIVSSSSQPGNVEQDEQYASLQALLQNRQKQRGQSFAALKKQAIEDVGSAIELLSRGDLNRQFAKGELSSQELCEILYNHRASGINLVGLLNLKQGLSPTALAKSSQQNALVLLRCRLYNQFSARELADIYYEHRHNKDFLKAIGGQGSYPNSDYIPPISAILAQAKREQVLQEVWKRICQSATLLGLLANEARNHHRHRNLEQERKVKFPGNDPYEVLGVDREASESDLKKAYRKKVLQVHPDKIATTNGERFKALNEAYEFLMDKENRNAWDRAHPPEEQPQQAGFKYRS